MKRISSAVSLMSMSVCSLGFVGGPPVAEPLATSASEVCKAYDSAVRELAREFALVRPRCEDEILDAWPPDDRTLTDIATLRIESLFESVFTHAFADCFIIPANSPSVRLITSPEQLDPYFYSPGLPAVFYIRPDLATYNALAPHVATNDAARADFRTVGSIVYGDAFTDSPDVQAGRDFCEGIVHVKWGGVEKKRMKSFYNSRIARNKSVAALAYRRWEKSLFAMLENPANDAGEVFAAFGHIRSLRAIPVLLDRIDDGATAGLRAGFETNGVPWTVGAETNFPAVAALRNIGVPYDLWSNAVSSAQEGSLRFKLYHSVSNDAALSKNWFPVIPSAP